MLGTLTLVLNGIRPLGLGITLSDIFYFLALLTLILEGISRRRASREWMPFHFYWLPSIGILLGGLLSSIFLERPLNSIIVTLKIFYLFSVWLSMIIVMAKYKGQAQNTIVALVSGVAFASCIAVVDSITGLELGTKFYNLDTAKFGLDPLLYSQTSGRYSGTLGHPNHLGQITAVALPIVVDRAWLNLSRRGKRFLGLAMVLISVLILWANIISGSVSGLIGASIAVFIVLVVRLRKKGRIPYMVKTLVFALGTSLALSIFIAQFNADRGWLNRQLSASFNRVITQSGPERFDLMGEALLRISDNPIIGYGMDIDTYGSDPSASVTSAGIHNTILRGWLAGGILTFIGALLIYGKTLQMAIQALIGHGRAPDNSYVPAIAASIIGWMVIDMVQPSIYVRYTWITVGLLYALASEGLKATSRRRME